MLTLDSITKTGVTLCICLTFAACGGGADSTLVNTPLGSVQGVERNGAIEFRGIPFSQPLEPKDRWSLAKPVNAWKNVLDADSFGKACAQERRFDLTEESLEENCLTLNISTPAEANREKLLPVMVWFPGGAFVGGSASLYRLDKLAREGKIVVVSANYRLGALGFMSHPSQVNVPWNGNLALEDQRLAMKWVQENIKYFGGDPNKVTIAGESAGAASVCLHLLSRPQTDGLFQQAIATSYGCLFEWPTVQSSLGISSANYSSDAEKPTWRLMAEKTGCFNPESPGDAQELACMRQKSVPEILAAQNHVAKVNPLFPFAPKIDSGPDGTVPLTGYSKDEISTHLNRVPLLLGGTQDELRLYVAYDVLSGLLPDHPSNIALETLKGYMGIYYGLDKSINWAEHYDRIINEYFSEGIITASAVGSMMSDYIPVGGANNCEALASAASLSQWTTVYQWEFADPNAPVLGIGIAPGYDPKMDLGPVHSSELNYIFPNLSNTAAIDAPDLTGPSQRLSDQLVQSWAAFVKSGSPVTSDTAGWKPYVSAMPSSVMRFEPDVVKSYDARAKHKCSFWESLDGSLRVK